jgi:uncharacterized protein RhaS with RHS repeats
VTSKNGTLAATSLPNAVNGNTYNADNGMTGFGASTLSYDANGNLTNDGTNMYAWDARNHLTGISGEVTASFIYDGLGRRMSKNLNGTATQFLYDWLNPVQEIQGGAPSANLMRSVRRLGWWAQDRASRRVIRISRSEPRQSLAPPTATRINSQAVKTTPRGCISIGLGTTPRHTRDLSRQILLASRVAT